MRRSWGTPIRPAAISSLTFRKLGSKRRLKPTWSFTPAFGHGGQGLVDSVHIQRDRLLTEDMFSRQGRLDHHPGMGIRGGTDHDRLNGFILQQLTVIAGPDRHLQLGGHPPGGLDVHIGDGGAASHRVSGI